MYLFSVSEPASRIESNFFMNNFDIILSFLSITLSRSSFYILVEIILTSQSLIQLKSIGSFTISLRFLLIKPLASSTNLLIFRKSADIKIEIQFLISNSGGIWLT